MSLPKLCVAQVGARMHYAIPRMLYESGMLAHFYTDICAVKGWPRLLNIFPKDFQSESMKRLLGRIPHGVPRQYITTFTNFGWQYNRYLAAANTDCDKRQVYLWAGKKICDLVLQQGFGSASGIYTFNNAGLELLQAASKKGLYTIMEQTSTPHMIERSILEDEHEKFPNWQLTTIENVNLSEKFAAREQAEWAQSDVILCASKWVHDSIAAVNGPVDRCQVVPYGVDKEFTLIKNDIHDGPLRVLTVGRVNLQKGSHYVLEAAKNLKGKALFHMIGNINVLPDVEVELRSYFEQLGPVPRSEIMSQYAWADVFLLPSLCEGSATVVYEALAAGLPVICTPNTGSVVRDGVDGFIVPIRDTNTIIEKLKTLENDREMLSEMSDNARLRGKEFTLDLYTQRLVAAIS